MPDIGTAMRQGRPDDGLDIFRTNSEAESPLHNIGRAAAGHAGELRSALSSCQQTKKTKFRATAVSCLPKFYEGSISSRLVLNRVASHA